MIFSSFIHLIQSIRTMRIISILSLFFLCQFSYAQQQVSKDVAGRFTSGSPIREVSLVQFVSSEIADRSLQLEGLTKGVILRIDEQAIDNLLSGDDELLRFKLPVTERQSMTLQLVRQQIFSEDFALYTSSVPGIPVNYTPGIHFKGVVEGDPTSVVAISVFNHEVMGLISTDHGNIILGRIEKDRENRHILYEDKDLEKGHGFVCGTLDDGMGYTAEELSSQSTGRDAGDCVRVYIEIDDDIVTQKGGATPATNYITGLFNQAITLYSNETVNMMISEILAWTTNSPYTGATSSAMLSSFQANSGDFNGNVGHLVSYQASGGIAVLDNLCSSNPDWRKCFSSIDATYQNVPTYSWSVMVITHEMGHVIGSKHTHACAWNGNNTAIDGCAGATEGGCAIPPIPSGGGTIMSYCHLTGAGINFNLGFGPQPGNVIRNRVNATGNCLTSCGPPPPPPPPSYCSASGTNSSYEWINKVILGTINNTSGNNGGYGNYTTLSTNLTAGTAYTINLTPGFAGAAYLEYWRVWIDYNGDLDWADSGEQVAQGTGTSAVNLAFTVPSGTPSGTKRMRIAMKYSGYASYCETFTYGEVEDYNVVIGGGSGPTCTDGIQNQGETGIDCGGPCPACPTCNDGIQNQGETGVDCGGPCPACPPPPPGGETTLLAAYFETGWDTWVDGGGDAARVSSTNSWEGTYAIRLADNSGAASAMTSPGFNLSNAIGFKITFYFKAVSFESTEDFWVRYKSGTGEWITVGQIIQGTHFNNNAFYQATVIVPGFVPTTQGKFRIQCDASDDTDQVYLDQVIISKLTGSQLIKETMTITEVLEIPFQPIAQNDEPGVETLVVFPNPANEVLNISWQGEIQGLKLMSLSGVELKVSHQAAMDKQIDIHELAPGMYFLWVQSAEEWHPVKFTKM
jgi:hypothetical protein